LRGRVFKGREDGRRGIKGTTQKKQTNKKERWGGERREILGKGKNVLRIGINFYKGLPRKNLTTSNPIEGEK